MQPSFYLKAFPSEEDSEDIILFSTLHLSKVLIKEETYNSIKQGEISSENEELLTKLGMIVPDREAERQSALNLFDELNERNIGLDCIAVLNLDCNFACKYCFEGELKGDLYMSGETADKLIGFIKERFTPDKETLLVDFSGDNKRCIVH